MEEVGSTGVLGFVGLYLGVTIRRPGPMPVGNRRRRGDRRGVTGVGEGEVAGGGGVCVGPTSRRPDRRGRRGLARGRRVSS